jgi:RNase P/RNase MRP subunit POP5
VETNFRVDKTNDYLLYRAVKKPPIMILMKSARPSEREILRSFGEYDAKPNINQLQYRLSTQKSGLLSCKKTACRKGTQCLMLVEGTYNKLVTMQSLE